MELILASIAAGGLVGAADQYLCLLIVSAAGKVGVIELAAPVAFMESWWFIAITALFWILTVAPSYASMLSPGVMHVITVITNTMSGFVVPFSSAVIALASAGAIAGMNPELRQALETLRIFTPEGAVGMTGVAVGVAGATMGAAVTGMKALAKPAASMATGTAGTVDLPIYTTIENLLSVVLMGLVYVLGKVNPWVLVALFVVVALAVLGLLIFAVLQLMRLKRGIGRALALTQTYPRAGLAVFAEFFVWGSGWMAWKAWGRSVVMFLFWLVVVAAMIALFPPLAAFSVAFPPLIVAAGLAAAGMYSLVGFGSARALLHHLEQDVLPAEAQSVERQAPA